MTRPKGAFVSTPVDGTRHGLTAGTPSNVREMARALMLAVKAFTRGLTNSLVLPAMRDDPHGAFNIGRMFTTSVLNSPMMDSARALSNESPRPRE